MKIIVIHSNLEVRHRLVKWLEQARGHVVLWSSDVPENWRALIAQHEPDLVLHPEINGAQGLLFVIATCLFEGCQTKCLPPSADAGISPELESLLAECEQKHREKQWKPRR